MKISKSIKSGDNEIIWSVEIDTNVNEERMISDLRLVLDQLVYTRPMLQPTVKSSVPF